MVEKLTLQRRLYQVNYFNLLSLHREIGMLFAFRGVVNEAGHHWHHGR